jgi:hypothetical protein
LRLTPHANFGEFDSSLIEFRFFSQLQKSREHLANVTSITEEFPHEEDFTGAVRGLMLLQVRHFFEKARSHFLSAIKFELEFKANI